MVLLGKHLTALVELAAGYADILIFRCLRREDHLHRFQMDAIHFAQCRQETNYDGCGRRQTANRQTSLNDARQTDFQTILFTQHLCCATQMICPVALPFFWHIPNKELGAFGEVQRLQFHNAILFRVVGHVDSLVDCQTIDFSVLMVNMRSQWANAIWTKSHIKWFLMVEVFIHFYALHFGFLPHREPLRWWLYAM